jgi:N-acetyl-anhydromuramyl-L-alanine amidase AmpD
MNIIDKKGVIVSLNRNPKYDVSEIILHDTVTPTADIAIKVLQQRGLGYHYLIEKNGDIIELVCPSKLTWHAAGYNQGTIGISFCCGGQFGAVNDIQKDAAVELIEDLKTKFPLKTLAGHRHRSVKGKIDPEGCDCMDMANRVGLIGPGTP